MLVSVFWILLIPAAAGIVYQDFRYRNIQVWLIALFQAVVWGGYLLRFPVTSFFINLLFCTLYAVLCYAILYLYFYFRTGKRVKLLDRKLGWGDVWVVFCIGPCLPPDVFVYFFTLIFIGALLLHFIFSGSRKTVPLAGYMVTGYVAYEAYLLMVCV